MAGLYAPDGGVNRLPKKWITLVGGVNKELKELYGVAGGANRKIFSSLSVGDNYTLGGYNWLVIDINAQGQATLFCKSNAIYETGVGGSWASSQMRTKCALLYNGFSASDKAKIITTSVISSTGNTSDNVWVLSATQIYGIGAVGNGYTAPSEGARLQWFMQHNTSNDIRTIITNSWTRSCYNGRNFIVDGTGALGSMSYSADKWGIHPVILINP